MRNPRLLLMLVLMLISASAQAVEYKVQRLVPEGKSIQFNWAYAINDKGQIVGRINNDIVIWNLGGETKRICSPTDDRSANPFGINNNGVVVAVYHDKKPTGTNSFAYENLLVTILDVDVVNVHKVPFSRGLGTTAAMNDNGWIVFTSLTENGRQGFIVKGDTVVPGNKWVSSPYAINNEGHIAGFSAGGVIIADTEGKAIRNAGSLPGCLKNCRTQAINEHDEAVGYASDSDSSFHAFVFRRNATELTELLRPEGYKSAVASDINDSGLVVGFLSDGKSQKAVAWDSQNRLIELPKLPNSQSSEAKGVNNAGQIVGVCSGAAVLWTPVEN